MSGLSIGRSHWGISSTAKLVLTQYWIEQLARQVAAIMQVSKSCFQCAGREGLPLPAFQLFSARGQQATHFATHYIFDRKEIQGGTAL